MQSNAGNEQRSDPSDSMPGSFEGGQANAHDPYDSKDSQSIGSKVQQAEKRDAEQERAENAKTITDPLAPARAHGNEPSRGAKVDAQIQQEEEEELRRKET